VLKAAGKDPDGYFPCAGALEWIEAYDRFAAGSFELSTVAAGEIFRFRGQHFNAVEFVGRATKGWRLLACFPRVQNRCAG
jgi:hypothetical protein